MIHIPLKIVHYFCAQLGSKRKENPCPNSCWRPGGACVFSPLPPLPRVACLGSGLLPSLTSFLPNEENWLREVKDISVAFVLVGLVPVPVRRLNPRVFVVSSLFWLYVAEW